MCRRQCCPLLDSTCPLLHLTFNLSSGWLAVSAAPGSSPTWTTRSWTTLCPGSTCCTCDPAGRCSSSSRTSGSSRASPAARTRPTTSSLTSPSVSFLWSVWQQHIHELLLMTSFFNIRSFVCSINCLSLVKKRIKSSIYIVFKDLNVADLF